MAQPRTSTPPPHHTEDKLLSGAVRAALTALDGPADDDRGERPFRTMTSARIARYLRAAIALTEQDADADRGDGVPLVVAACVALDAGDVPEAHLALRAARHALRDSDIPPPLREPLYEVTAATAP